MLAELILVQFGPALNQVKFAEILLSLLDDVPGFEIKTSRRSGGVISHIRNIYMATSKGTASQVAGTKEANLDAASQPALHLSAKVKDAIEQGKKLLAESKTKADAARTMYELIGDEPKEIIVAAFIKGAGLTEKGALTYWYNCKRRASKKKMDESK